MYTSETKIRVRYGETDQMGFVYYGNYASFYEVGRTEMMRTLGITYKDMEQRGCMMPSVTMSLRYLRPARYDDELRIVTSVKVMPSTRMTFYYEIFNAATGQLLNTGETTLAFINTSTYRPMRAPEWFLQLITNKLNELNITLNT